MGPKTLGRPWTEVTQKLNHGHPQRLSTNSSTSGGTWSVPLGRGGPGFFTDRGASICTCTPLWPEAP